jgi:hypothetical protein
VDRRSPADGLVSAGYPPDFQRGMMLSSNRLYVLR